MHKSHHQIIAGVIIFSIATTVSAIGKVCSNFEITFDNNSSDEIKVTKFEFFNYKNSKWKTENMFGVDGHQKINPGKKWTKKRDLETVEDRDTKFRAYFKRAIGGNKWETKESVTGDKFTCVDRGKRTLTIEDKPETNAGVPETLHAEGSDLATAATAVQALYPNMKKAVQATSPKFIDSHSKNYGTGHADLAGYGVTMVAHNGKGPKPGIDKLEYWNGELDEPNELFFEKGAVGRKKKWEIIGMGYGVLFDPSISKTLQVDGQTYPFLIHEAGYHRLGDGGFDCADDGDLKTKAWDNGLRVDPEGTMNVQRDDLKSRTSLRKVRHGRLWTLHIWFDPETDLPVVAETDPWQRQSSNALVVPDCAFFYPS